MTIANAVGFCDEEWQLGIGGPSVAMLSPAASTPPPSNADLHWNNSFTGNWRPGAMDARRHVL